MPEDATLQGATAKLANAAMYEQVRRWYLARLRRSAVLNSSITSENSTLTPARLIAVDRDYVEKMILEHPSAVRKAKVRAKSFESASARVKTAEPLQLLWEQSARKIVMIAAGIQIISLVAVTILNNAIPAPFGLLLAMVCSLIAFLALADEARKITGSSAGRIETALNSVSNQQIEQIQECAVREIDVLTTVIHDLSHQLTESQTREEAIADHALDLIFAIDREGKFISISPSSHRIWGYSAKKLEGKPISLVISPEHAAQIEELLKTPKSGKETNLEVLATKKDGSKIFLSWSMEWSNTDNVMFCFARDITLEKESERILRESEANMRTLIDKMPIGLVTLAPDGKIDSTNPRTREIFGYDTSELEREHPQILFGEKKDVSREQYVDQLARDSFGKISELRTRKKDGSIVYIETTCSTIHTTTGERLLVTIIDVSDRQELEKLKRRFVALVSHELRTPLTSIQLFLELLTAGSLGEISAQAAKRARGVIEHLRRLLSLVEDLLSVEKMASGQFSMKFENIILQSVMNKAADSVDELAQQAGVTIEIATTNSLEIVADEERLVQALINLISNAIKFSQRGSTVTVAAEQHQDEVEIRVIDKGPGIAPGVAAGLFQPFRQSPGEQARPSRRGTGLGLYICKLIIEQHGGTVSLDSEEGKGSTFILRFPAAPPA
ncbi:MAG: PAS domain-containing sensor histidine kinase [Candidatus Obscuribacterales bacterium]|nr:PAS domain-containing sensor histidine kinase [Candidatus Obscuribacterales bacterium]